MELIKKIKEAEAQAEEIIEQAKSEAAKQTQKTQSEHIEALAEAEKKRKKVIEAAIATANSQGLAEVEKLKAQAEQNKQKLRKKAGGRMDKAIAKVMEFLKG